MLVLRMQRSLHPAVIHIGQGLNYQGTTFILAITGIATGPELLEAPDGSGIPLGV